MYGHRVVVTGLGCISPIGLSVDEYWQNLLGGVSGAGRITTFDPDGLPVQIAADHACALVPGCMQRAREH